MHCQSCGRPFGKKEHLESVEVKYCSKECRKQKLDKKDTELDEYIVTRLHGLAGKNICPSLISREYFKDSWRTHHQRTVRSCRRLHLANKIKITQKKIAVSDLNFKGPFRIQKK